MKTESHSSFGFYESARILVPGFSFAFLLWLFIRSLLRVYVPSFGIEPDVFLVLFVSLIAGFTLYAKEGTKRRKAFRQNQPSLYLQNKARMIDGARPLSEDEARRMYFYILNNHIPDAFHEKIFFFGTIYHVMIQIRRTSFWFGIVSLPALGFAISSGQEFQALLLFTFVVWLIYLINVRYNKADRKMQENYQDQIYWLQMNNAVVEQTIRSHQSLVTIRNEQ